MQDPFDPYTEWLGIAETARPLDHYTLLGLTRGENDLRLIAQAADMQMARVRRVRPGAHLADWGQLLDHLTAVKACLLDPASKAAYDAQWPTAPGGPTAPASQPQVSTAFPPTLAMPPSLSGPPLDERTRVPFPVGYSQTPVMASASLGRSAPPVQQATSSPAWGAAGTIPVPPGAVPASTPLLPQAPAAQFAPSPAPAANQPYGPAFGAPPVPGGYQQPAPAAYQQPGPAGYQPPAADYQQPMPTGYQSPAATGYQQPMPTGFQQPLPAASAVSRPDAWASPVATALALQSPPGDAAAAAAVGQPLPAAEASAAVDQATAPADFGVAKGASPAVATPRRSLIGPALTVGLASVIIGLGCVLYWVLNDHGDTIALNNPAVAGQKDNSGAGPANGTATPASGQLVKRPPQSGIDAGTKVKPKNETDPKKHPEKTEPAEPGPKTDPADPASGPKKPDQPGPATPPGKEDPQKRAAYAKAVSDARFSMGERDLDGAKKHLQTAAGLLQTPADQAELHRLQQILTDLDGFWKSIRKVLPKLEAGTDLPVKDTFVAIVDSNENELIIKAAGQLRRYQIETMPTLLVTIIAQQRFKQDAPWKALQGSFLAMDPDGDRAQARQLWREATQGGHSTDELLPELDVPRGDARQPGPNGKGPKTSSAGSKTFELQMTQLEEREKSAKTLPAHSEVARDALKAAEAAAASSRWDDAARLAELALSAAKSAKSPALMRQAAAASQQIESMRQQKQ